MGAKKTSAKAAKTAKTTKKTTAPKTTVKAAPERAAAAKPAKDAGGAKAPSAATLRYVIADTRVTLGGGDDGVTEHEEDGVSKLAFHGVPYATYRVDGNDLVVTVKKPQALGELASKLGHYDEQPGGWLRWRTPVSRDPRPWLDADVGTMTGRAMREILAGRGK